MIPRPTVAWRVFEPQPPNTYYLYVIPEPHNPITMTLPDLHTEWCLLQNQFDSYEKHSLWIKLIAMVTTVAMLQTGVNGAIAAMLLLVLWGQDAIWKTFQSRIEARLLLLERAIAQKQTITPFQLNSQFEETRSGIVGLLGEYARQAVRPTIAIPHVILLPMLIAAKLSG